MEEELRREAARGAQDEADFHSAADEDEFLSVLGEDNSDSPRGHAPEQEEDLALQLQELAHDFNIFEAKNAWVSEQRKQFEF